MATALLLTNSDTLWDIYALNLKAYVDVTCIEQKDLNSCLLYLETTQKLDLIITQSQVQNEKIAKGIFNYILARELKEVPMIVIGHEPELQSSPGVYFIENKYSLKEVVRRAAKVLNVTAKHMAQKEVPDYFPIPIRTLENIPLVTTDVFRLRGENNVEKVFGYGPVSSELIRKLQEEGVRELYIPSLERLRFTNLVSQSLSHILSNPTLSEKSRIEATNAGYEFVAEHIAEIHNVEELVEVSKQCVESMSFLIEQNPKAKNLLEKLFENQTSYAFKHCQLNAFIASHIVMNHEWGAKEHTEKLAFISFFHDILLPTKEMIVMENDKELKASTLSDEDKKVVQYHALKTSELIQTLPRAPLGADIIVKQHHGMMGGIGFENKKFSNNLSPLAIIFIVAEDFVKRILDTEKIVENKCDYSTFDKKTALETMLEKYPNSSYKRAIRALELLDI